MNRRQRDERDVFKFLFCGIPAEEQECWFNERALALVMDWSTARFEDALARLQARGVITLSYTAGGYGHARLAQEQP